MKASWIAGVLVAVMLTTGLVQSQRPEAETPRYVPAQVVSVVEAAYPPTSIAWGTVVLQVTVERDGSVAEVRVLRDIKSLTPEAEKAVRRWKFRPATLDGQPVRSAVPVAFVFRTVTPP
jgi:TonB family protein